MGHKRIGYKEQRIIEDLLRGRLTMIGEGFCKYNGNGSDDHVVAEARMKGVDGCTKFNVRHVRREIFGELRMPRPERPAREIAVPGVVLDRLTCLEHDLTSLGSTNVETGKVLAAIERELDDISRDLNMVMDYLTRAHGVNWTMEDFTTKLKEQKGLANEKPKTPIPAK